MSGWAEMTEAKTLLSETMADLQTGYSEGYDTLLSDNLVFQEQMNTDTKDGMAAHKDTLEAGGKELIVVSEATITGMADAIDTNRPLVTEAMNQTTQEMVSTTQTGLNIVDGKSVVFTDIGLTIPAGIAEGIRQGTSEVATAICEMVNAAVAAVDVDAFVSGVNKQLGAGMGIKY
jgi:hypothetical protein